MADFPTTDTFNSDIDTAIALETHSRRLEIHTQTNQFLKMKVAAILALIPAAFAVINNEARDS